MATATATKTASPDADLAKRLAALAKRKAEAEAERREAQELYVVLVKRDAAGQLEDSQRQSLADLGAELGFNPGNDAANLRAITKGDEQFPEGSSARLWDALLEQVAARDAARQALQDAETERGQREWAHRAACQWTGQRSQHLANVKHILGDG